MASICTIFFRHIPWVFRSLLFIATSRKAICPYQRLICPEWLNLNPEKKQYSAYVPAALKAGRFYEDFSLWCEQNNLLSWVEMDTVIGRIGGKCILTFDFTFCNFMFGLLLDNKTAAEVSAKIIALKERLTGNGLCFGTFFSVILTDNGGEFSNVFAVENDLKGLKESALFFCDPYKSSQKPHVEKNHTLLRDILPKGSSFDSLTQDAVNMIFSHINSVKRKHFNGKSAFELFAFAFGHRLPAALEIVSVAPESVIQSPRLLNIIQHRQE